MKIPIIRIAGLLACGLGPVAAFAQPAPEELRQHIAEQALQLEQLKRLLAAQEAALAALRRQVDAAAPAAAVASVPVPVPAPLPAADSAPADAAPLAVAPIFEQPGVLTPRGRTTLEPSLQFSYSSSNRVALVGYTVIPAILVGLVDVREVRRSTWTGALALRHGVSSRLEVEAKLPYVWRDDNSIGRELLQGASGNTAAPFDAGGRGIGDIEATARYQLNDVGAERATWVGSLRVKSRSGRDPFHARVSTAVQGFTGDGLQTELPTGSGFVALQPALTVLYPSDPAVFFGTVSYLHSLRRNDVVQATDAGPVALGSIAPGGIFGFNFGMGLALNEKSSFSIGYDHSAVGRTRRNGAFATDSVPLQLGTLLLGYSLRQGGQRSVNVSLGAGLTRDTPDVTLTLRMPTTF